MTRRATCLLLLAAAAACKKDTPAPADHAPAAAAPASAPAAKPKARGPIAWIDDDWGAAIAKAKAEKKPVFVDMWAPWCHTCLSMQAFVFADPGVAPDAARFVWLAIDTEKRANAPVVKKLPLGNWPTFFVVDPDSETVLGRQVGAMSLAELRAFLGDTERAYAVAHGVPGKPGDPMALEIAGHAAAQKNDWPAALAAYRGALDRTDKASPRRAGLLAAWMQAFQHAKQPGACVDAGLAEIPALPHLPSSGDFIFYTLKCAGDLPKADPRREAARKAALAAIPAIAADAAAPLSADDRQDMWRIQKEILEEQGDKDGARQAAEKRLAILEEAAAKAPDALARSTYDAARMETFQFLGRGEEAVKLLDKSEADLPDDYDPPARLALAHMALGHYGEALAAADRALARCDGPRKARIYDVKADILEKQGLSEEVRKVLTESLAYYRGLPEGQRRPEDEAHIEKRLAGLAAAAAKP